MLDRHPDMLAVDAQGRPRGFGSRRHYCFSHRGYRQDCARIVDETLPGIADTRRTRLIVAMVRGDHVTAEYLARAS